LGSYRRRLWFGWGTDAEDFPDSARCVRGSMWRHPAARRLGFGGARTVKGEVEREMRAVVRVLLPRLSRDTTEVFSLQVGCHRDQELEGARNTWFRQVWATESVIPNVLCGLYFLRW
jgi:hypothetical protein